MGRIKVTNPHVKYELILERRFFPKSNLVSAVELGVRHLTPQASRVLENVAPTGVRTIREPPPCCPLEVVADGTGSPFGLGEQAFGAGGLEGTEKGATALLRGEDKRRMGPAECAWRQQQGEERRGLISAHGEARGGLGMREGLHLSRGQQLRALATTRHWS